MVSVGSRVALHALPNIRPVATWLHDLIFMLARDVGNGGN